MKNKIAIIGSGFIASAIEKIISLKRLDKPFIVAPDEAKSGESNIVMDSKYINIEYEKPPEINLYPNKPFVCTGKHQYRKVEKKEGNITNVEWICQCGRKIK